MIAEKKRDISQQTALPWPYEVNYGKENRMEADVLVLGGGVGGINAAIAAAKEGASVILVDKAPVQRSGSGGVGHDHWLEACTNPGSLLTPEYFVDNGGTVLMGPMRYICAKTSWDNVAELEQMGMVMRDYQDEFKGARFRNDEFKLMYAYDYKHRTSLRLYGGNDMKPTLAKEVDRLGITRVERVMGTRLFYSDEGGKRRVTGAMGVHMHTGECYVFRAKNVVVATGGVYGMWMYRNDVLGACSEFPDPNGAGDGHAMAWLVGADTAMMERAGSYGSSGHINGQPSYGGASCANTMYPCNIVDADGKTIPWVDHEGNPIEKLEDRNVPQGNSLFLTDFGNDPRTGEYGLIPDLAERVYAGEYKLPLYMDLPSMPPLERRALWGLMVANEGKSLEPVYNKYSRAGFNPDTDMIQVCMMPPERLGKSGPWWAGDGHSTDRDSGMFGGAGGFLVDWHLKSTNIDGLYGAGYPIMAHGCSEASSSGRYAGRHAAYDSATIDEMPVLDEAQVKIEKDRVYTALHRKNATIGWRELQAGMTRIIRDYLNDYKVEETLKIGLFWLKSLIETENEQVYVRNPHELVRYLEVQNRLVVAEMYFEACLGRVRRHGDDFFKTERSPWIPHEWGGEMQVQNYNDKDGTVVNKYIHPYYELQEPYKPTYRENFYDYNADYDEKYAAKEDGSWINLPQY